MTQKETLEEAAERYVNFESPIAHPRRVAKNAFINGGNWQQERMHFDISEKWGEYRNVTNNEDAYLFMVWLKEQFKNK